MKIEDDVLEDLLITTLRGPSIGLRYNRANELPNVITEISNTDSEEEENGLLSATMKSLFIDTIRDDSQLSTIIASNEEENSHEEEERHTLESMDNLIVLHSDNVDSIINSVEEQIYDSPEESIQPCVKEIIDTNCNESRYSSTTIEQHFHVSENSVNKDIKTYPIYSDKIMNEATSFQNNSCLLPCTTIEHFHVSESSGDKANEIYLIDSYKKMDQAVTAKIKSSPYHCPTIEGHSHVSENLVDKAITSYAMESDKIMDEATTSEIRTKAKKPKKNLHVRWADVKDSQTFYFKEDATAKFYISSEDDEISDEIHKINLLRPKKKKRFKKIRKLFTGLSCIWNDHDDEDTGYYNLIKLNRTSFKKRR